MFSGQTTKRNKTKTNYSRIISDTTEDCFVHVTYYLLEETAFTSQMPMWAKWRKKLKVYREFLLYRMERLKIWYVLFQLHWSSSNAKRKPTTKENHRRIKKLESKNHWTGNCKWTAAEGDLGRENNSISPEWGELMQLCSARY